MLNRTILVIVLFCYCITANSQTPIQLSSQPNFTYTENFSDIGNWVFNTTPQDGNFASGIGATAWNGNVVNATGTVPSALRIVASSLEWKIPPTGSGGYGSGVYKENERLTLLATGTSDNNNSVAMDLNLNFTGVNVGTLSFDWASLNNSTGNRNGSLRVYATIDGTTFTEITGAQVLNFTNNSPTSGSIVNIPMPTIFNNSATAKLRFYYHNGSGGTTGSRPRLGLDNVKVTAVPTTPCATPTAQATNFVAGTVINNAITFSFTPASPAPQNYLVVISNNSVLTSNPTDLTTYSVGDELGDGNVISIANNSTITATGLNASTTYYFFVFSTNNACTGGPLYLTASPLTGSATTLAGALPCAAPPTQPTNLQFSNVGLNSITGTFTAAANTNEYLIVRSLSSTFSGTLNNGTTYNGGNVLGNGSVVTRTAANTFTANNLVSGTTYYFYVFGLNNQNCTSGPVYNSISPLSNNISTTSLPTCVTPTAQATNLNITISNTSSVGYFSPSTSADAYLIIRSTSSTLNTNPVDNTNYTIGSSFGNGTVIQVSNSTGFIDNGLTSSTTYYYFVFAMNSNCNGGTKYLTTNPLTATITTTAVAALNYYFGNLHAHSSYSDGNQDNNSLTPANDYAYAKNSLCMDFLGISEHNHATAGMHIADWQPGLNQAAAATSANFLALYGMEWGVLSNGGHVLIYGTNQLIGWENNNYNIYVPKSDYIGTPETTGTTGLFRTINQLGGNAFATFAHPSFSDFNNLTGIAYNATADSAVVGMAIASGPAFSTNTTYSDPPSSFSYIDFYTRMLSKGYHIGPMMDHDTHYTNFGRSSNNRLVTIAPALNSNDFYTAMLNRNFYATEDCDTRVQFTLNNQLMGSIANGTLPPTISVYAIDPTNPSFTPTIKVMYGVAGSNIPAIQLTSIGASTLNYTDYSLSTGINAYYYLDITIAGNRTITAPIWYTKTAVVPVKLLSFTATLNSNKKVNLQWSTTNEINNHLFVVEKSFDGNSFTQLGSIEAKNNVSINEYSLLDAAILERITYYRLKQIDKNGKFSYSNIVSVNPVTIAKNTVAVYPNPIVGSIMNIGLQSTQNTKAALMITDVTGRIVLHQQSSIIKGSQLIQVDVSRLSTGTYYLTVLFNNEKITQKISK
ncbi:MAG: T9SS type A sorting domain-containing protein [Chitinophagaceae bacterium]|jgi:hypothetical protein